MVKLARVYGIRFRVYCLGFSVFELWVLGLRLTVYGIGFMVLG